MRSFQILLLSAILVFVVITVITTASSEEPAKQAITLLHRISNNDFLGAVKEFGDNTCHCAPKGGYEAYLQYEKCNDPNLAFLLGRQFSIGTATTMPLPAHKEESAMPWEKPEDSLVSIPISFPTAAAQPYFIPLNMAFGYDTPESELKDFTQDPAKDWMKGFTLRLRPRLDKGLVAPTDPRPPKREKNELVVDEKLLPADMAKYFHPKDAGMVKLASGQALAATEYADRLPRLQSIVIEMKMVRRGWMSRWAVKKIGISSPVIMSDGHSFKLSEPN